MSEPGESDQKHYLERELQELLQSDPRTWEFLQQGSLDGCWYWDLERPDQEWMSPEFWRLLGIDPTTRRHDPVEWQDLIFPEDLETALANFEKHTKDPNHPYDQVVRYRHANGSTVWVRCRGLAVRDTEGRPIRMLGAHNDLTAVKRAEEKERRLRESADAANAELRTFSYALSHDLRAPINTMTNVLSELAQNEAAVLSEDGRNLLQMARAVTSRMHSLTDGLMNFTAVLGDQVDPRNIDLAQLLDEVIQDLDAEIRTSAGQIESIAMPVVFGDPNQLRRLFSNLLTNALKYRHPERPPKIRIHAEAQGERTLLHVQDNGIGIDPKHHERIFQLFERLHSQKVPGSGLGLALCRRVVQNHGGALEVARSSEAEGTTFRFDLPLAPS